MTKYIPASEQTKMIRKALKEAFGKRVEFSVQCRQSAINISWTDGPTKKDVDAIVKKFEGAYFDAMEDYKGYKIHKINGEEVSFAIDFIFTIRTISPSYQQDCENKISKGLIDICKLWNSSNSSWIKMAINQAEEDDKDEEVLKLQAELLALETGIKPNQSPPANAISYARSF